MPVFECLAVRLYFGWAGTKRLGGILSYLASSNNSCASLHGLILGNFALVMDTSLLKFL